MAPTTNTDIRKWYLDELAKIPKLDAELRKAGIPLKERARMAWRFRHDKRREARSFMADKDEVEMLRRRDVQVYGSPNGPTFQSLFKKLKAEGLLENEVYEAIIKGSYRTNAGVDKNLGF